MGNSIGAPEPQQTSSMRERLSTAMREGVSAAMTMRERLSATTYMRERLSTSTSMRAAMNMVDCVIEFSSGYCCTGSDVEVPGQLNNIKTKYEFMMLIGVGQTAKVHKCICKTTREEVACKITADVKIAYDEIHILHMLNLNGGSPGILRLDSKWPGLRHPHKSKYVYLITEFCNGGDLRRIVDMQGRLPTERETAKIIKSLVESLQFCHSRRIIHRDVKLSSIFLSYDAKYTSLTTKLGNFDRATRLKPGQHFVYDNVGTVEYSAPEMRSGRGYSYEVDIWSAGVVLYLLLCGRMPFDQAESDATTYDQILEQNTKPDVAHGQWSSVSDSAKDLVLGMLQKRIWNRLSCDQILSHPWILANTGDASTSNTGDASTSRVATSANKEKTSTSKIDTRAASSESNKEESGSSSTTVKEAASAEQIDFNSRSNAESGSSSRTPLLRRDLKGKSKVDL